ncbi:tubby C-terminal-like domain-containing protein [Gaertneriomyces semiglobifer]|nr:tubby C-terminal-like domain-containing protein [Gaertneriomyces semiglobifer]
MTLSSASSNPITSGLAALAGFRPHLTRSDSEAQLSEAAVGALETINGDAGATRIATTPGTSTVRYPGPVPPRRNAQGPSGLSQSLSGLSLDESDSSSEADDDAATVSTDLNVIRSSGESVAPQTQTFTAPPVFTSLHNVLGSPIRREADFDHTFSQRTGHESATSFQSFVMSPVPMGRKLLCRIVRRKTTPSEKMYPRYDMYIEEDDETRTLILTARNRKKTRSSYYVIEACENRGKAEPVGTVRSNFLGTAFGIYGPSTLAKQKDRDKQSRLREEYGAVLYEPNLLGFKGPRKMTVLLPAMTKDGNRIPCIPENDKASLIPKFRMGDDRDILTLHNKQPQWNEETNSFVLNFNGRVTLASVKNFQIVHDNDLDYIIMQFGRVEQDSFTIDFQYPMSCVQAFAIALTSFDAKLACE